MKIWLDWLWRYRYWSYVMEHNHIICFLKKLIMTGTSDLYWMTLQQHNLHCRSHMESFFSSEISCSTFEKNVSSNMEVLMWFVNKNQDIARSIPTRICPRTCCFGTIVFVSSAKKLYGNPYRVTRTTLFLVFSKIYCFWEMKKRCSDCCHTRNVFASGICTRLTYEKV